MRKRAVCNPTGVTLTILAVSVLSVAGLAGGAPIVTGVSGPIDQRTVITVTGSSFGAAPHVVLFDDFEGGTSGNTIMTGAGSAMYGQWAYLGGTPQYTNSSAVSGSLSFQADMSISWVQYIAATLPPGTRDFFICWWMFIPAGDRIPGEGTTNNTNWKTIWVQGSGTTDDDITLPTILSTSKLITANDSPYTKYMGIGFQKGEWKRLWVWTKGGYSNDGQCHYWELDDPNGVIQRVNDNNVTLMYSGGIRERVHVNGYGRTTPDCHPGFDDVYIGTGANARARVEIGNNPVYGNCTALAISVPTSWSATSITATVNVGGLDPLDDWYIFVVDAAGNISPGYLVAGSRTLTVTNGSGSGQYPPNAVVSISANAPASGKRFAIWVGDYTYVADRFQASTTVTMPATDITVIAAYINVYTLTVNSGTGDGQYSAGAVVAIAADAAATGKDFDQWTGDIAGVADTESASTTFTMSATDADVTATYADIPPAYWPGDVDQSLLVSGPDLDIILTQWGRAGTEITDPRADISGDGLVSGPDLDIILTDWGKTGSPQ